MSKWVTKWVADYNDPNYYDAESVTMNEIRFYLSDDANNMLSNFKNGTWLVIEHVPTNEITALKQQYPGEGILGHQTAEKWAHCK